MNLPRVRECEVGHTAMWYISRPGTPMSEYLHRDGTWHLGCGVANMYETKEEALAMIKILTIPDILLDIEL